MLRQYEAQHVQQQIVQSRGPLQSLTVDVELAGEGLGELEVGIRVEPVRAVAPQLDDTVKIRLSRRLLPLGST